jgi:hypothetical protein
VSTEKYFPKLLNCQCPLLSAATRGAVRQLGARTAKASIRLNELHQATGDTHNQTTRLQGEMNLIFSGLAVALFAEGDFNGFQVAMFLSQTQMNRARF